LGAATADTIYGAIAAFSIRLVIDFLIREVFWIRLAGGILLIGLGIRYYFKEPHSLREVRNVAAHSDYVTALLLNLTNPTTVLSFLAVLASLGMSHDRALWLNFIVVAGILFGAMVWWIALALMANHFRARFDDRGMLWMNRIAGLAIGAFGVVTLILSRAHS
jgi:threonine/homoserine/homoserine lactone efflux protein